VDSTRRLIAPETKMLAKESRAVSRGLLHFAGRRHRIPAIYSLCSSCGPLCSSRLLW
jgi:hypothetical protein